MSIKRKVITTLVVCILILVTGGASTALGSGEGSPDQGVLPGTWTIPYSGYLTDQTGTGTVADGAYDLTFTLYNTETDGIPLWSETLTGLPVQNGAFTALLGDINPLPEKTQDSQELWLAVSVRSPNEAAFTDLNPRQRLIDPSNETLSSTMAGPSCPHNHWGEFWTGSGNQPGLHVNGNGGYALEGWSTGNIGVLGISTTSAIVIPSGMTGLYGIGDNYGVEAYGTHGAYFAGWDDHQDLILGGNVGRINANSSANSQLYLSSNADVIVKLDNDSGDNSVFRVESSGGGDACTIDEGGNLACAGSKAGYVADIAQNDETNPLVQGDVVMISGMGPAVLGEIPIIKVRRATDSNAAAVIGIVDQHYLPTSPDGMYQTEEIAPGEYLTLVTLGAYKAINVDASYGAIHPGDLLVASPHVGYAMRTDSPAPGTIIGKALGELLSGTGAIAVMVSLQ